MYVPDCQCTNGDFRKLTNVRNIGYDKSHSKICLEQCAICGTYWLQFAHDEPGFTGSDLWYRLAVKTDQLDEINEDNARTLFENSDWYWAGGSFYRIIQKRQGKLVIAPWIGVS